MKPAVGYSVTFLLAVGHVLALPTEVGSPIDDAITLHPISIRDYEAAAGLQRRDSGEFTDLDLQDQARLIYGSPGYEGQKILADMTLYAPQGLQVVAMEKFEPLTSSVDCDAGDNIMSLTFKSKGAYDYALKKWSFINENKDDKFLLIANHAGCGPDDQRQPYLVSSVDDDAKLRKVFLAATKADWSEVAGTYELAFGKELPKTDARRLRPRLSWDDVKEGLEDAYETTTDAVEEVGEGIADAAQGNADLSKSITFSVPVGTEGVKTPLYTTESGNFALDCVDCYVKGSFKVTGHVKVQNFKLQDLTIDASPQGFQAMLKLEATIKASKQPLTLNDEKELFSGPIPAAGVRVPKIFKLGATWSYSVGYNVTFAGEGVVDFGVEARIPDSAKATINLAGPTGSSASGWKGTLNPLFEVKSLSASVSVAAYSAPQLSFGIELEKVGRAEIALNIKAPEISSTLTAKYAPEGVCEDDAKKTKTGIDLVNQVVFGASVEVNAELGKDQNNALPKWSKDLFSIPIPLPGKCWPLNIPALLPGGGGDAGDTTPAPPTPSGGTTPPSGGNTCTIPNKLGDQKGTCIKTAACTASGGTYKAGLCPNDPDGVLCCTKPDPPPPTGGGGGGCKKVKRGRNGKRVVIPC